MVIAGSHLLEYLLKLLEPECEACLRTLGSTAEARIAHHTLRRYVYLLPVALLVDQLDVETLVAILLWRVDVVAYAAGLLLEVVGKHRVDV